MKEGEGNVGVAEVWQSGRVVAELWQSGRVAEWHGDYDRCKVLGEVIIMFKVPHNFYVAQQAEDALACGTT
jgi:hypothetical protein